MLGFAMGVLGMSLADFCQLEPSEFDAICTAYHSRREAEEQSQWERTRMLACITIQPHVRKKLKPRDILTFPWEAVKKKTTPPVSKEDQWEMLQRRLGKI